VLLFACWWLYFLDSDAPRLAAHRERSFIWGYGHFFVFAALAALGAGIEVTVEAISHEVAASGLLIGYSVALPLAIFLAARYALYVRTGGHHLARDELIVAELAIVLAIPLASTAVGPAWILAAVAVTAAGLVAYKTVRLNAVSAGEAVDTSAMSVARHHAAHEDAEGPQGRQGRAPGTAEGEVSSTT
jgi:low temperature requirement protein LtrA